MVLNSPDADAYRRGVLVARGLGERAGVRFRMAATCDPRYAESVDTLVLLGPVDRWGFELMCAAKESGARVVLDVDRWHDLPPYDASYSRYSALRPYPELALGLADVVVCATDRIAAGVEDANPTTVTVRGWLDAPIYDSHTPAERRAMYSIPDDAVVITIGRRSTDQQSLNLVSSALEYLVCSRTDLWVIMFGAETGSPFVPQERLVRCLSERFAEQQALTSMADIALLPLERSTFNERLNASRLLDCGSFGMPCLCSPVGPYMEMSDIGVPLVMCDDAAEWRARMEEYAGDASKRHELGERTTSAIESALPREEGLAAWSALLGLG